ncbi:hypothetical protein SDC9_182933 [bioreactor metagenome]|uniref:Uncharacterized protein n=1 Tax=bioreactor metagenome TaxID=1076179 RepID=A0A645H8W3_9ZZZZ
MHRLDELLIYRDGYAVTMQHGLQRAAEAMRPRAKHVRLNGGGVGCVECVFNPAIGLIEGFIGLFSHASVGVDEEHIIAAVGELHRFAVFIDHRTVVEIHIRQHRKHVVGPGKRFLRHGKQAFLRG